MKKFSLFLLFALPFACSLNSCSSDDETEKVSITLDATNLTNDGYFDGMMYYKITSNSPNEVAVNKAEASVIKIEIPSNVKIEGNVYKCTSIAKEAFKNCKSLTTISIPNNVATIGVSAFWNCVGLTSIDIPNSVTTIGENTFYECRGLTSISIPNSVTTIERGAFYGCSGLTSINIPNSVTSIEEGAFSFCSELKEIHCKATNPPANNYSFDNDTYNNAILYIPKGTLDAYKKTYWKNFKNIVEE